MLQWGMPRAMVVPFIYFRPRDARGSGKRAILGCGFGWVLEGAIGKIILGILL